MKGLFYPRNEVIKILENKDYELFKGDCLELMNDIPDKSIDMILCDLPYGTTACKWDSIIDLDMLWKHYKRILTPRGNIILFASQPFTTTLISSNLSWFRYGWVWEKESGSNFLSVNYMPLKIHEDILVFSRSNDIGTNEELREYFYNEKIKGGFSNKEINEMLGYSTKGSGMAGHYFKKDKEQFSIPKERDYLKLQETGYFPLPYSQVVDMYNSTSNTPTYNPQKSKGKPYSIKQGRGSEVYNNKDNAVITNNNGDRFPTSILKFNRDKERFHPTQKPVDLLEYLIKTYSNEGEVILDNAMGSGSTGVAALNLHRKFIGMELDEKYFQIAKERIGKVT